MPGHPHQVLGFASLKLALQWILHTIAYYWFTLLMHLRYHNEILCWHIGMASHWRDNNTGRIFIHPWCYMLVHYPTVYSWHFLNLLRKTLEAIHPQLCEPELFTLPATTYYDLNMDFNHN